MKSKYNRLEVYPDGKIVKKPSNDEVWLNDYFHFYPSGSYEDLAAHGTVCLPEDVKKQTEILKAKVLVDVEEKIKTLERFKNFAKNLNGKIFRVNK